MIITVTLNAALDVTYRVASLRPHATHRVLDTAQRPGGKGINAARVLAALGHPVVVTGFAGGATGDELRRELAGPARAGLLTDALVPIAGPTRRTVAVVDERTGDTTQFNEPGPTVSAAEWAGFLAGYRELLTAGGVDAVALCGSLPPGVPVGAYADLVREARSAGLYTLLDTSGEPLRRGLAARPDLIKPNAEELTALTGISEPVRAAQVARRRGARAVAASLGPDGMLAVAEDGEWRAAPPGGRLAGNPTGAGDSAVAALLSGFAEHLPWPDRLARAVALSAATVAAPAAGEYDRPTYDKLLPRVTVTAP
ncbi:1-phosphofructokinase family hexose kinase [Actinacidiphila acididurans]|uniref:1-phosphofructokinase family hexose kinase n=1 Tax=Actinacidiphila acididurans TaxID=2784346 RepID=A0ABS2TQB0_9ACTN|nr:1-phosphofructokinase family hexose kinase [Actinacidiphila acididurans]MBM9505201.1 1-phosphofructokinase family hexose kinase [Actinacidiphila acididurans]